MSVNGHCILWKPFFLARGSASHPTAHDGMTALSNRARALLSYPTALAQKHLNVSLVAFRSFPRVLGNFDDELHGVFGLVAESPPNGIHSVLMRDTLEALSID